MSKYQRNEIKDLFSFFSLPWLSVTLSEEFVELQKVNRMLANLRDYCNKEPVVTEMALRTYEEVDILLTLLTNPTIDSCFYRC